jgi:hypothetical protein
LRTAFLACRSGWIWATAFDSWCESNELSDEAISVFRETISEAAEQSYGNANDDSVRSLLKTLAQPFPKATETTPNKDGLTPEAGETSTKRFLAQLRTFKHPDPYGNQSLDADHYKAFDREANRYGRNYSYANDWNNQRPTWPLANPKLNVNSGATDQREAFEAVDSVGLGAKVHWRVVNRLTNEYVTRQIEKTQAESIAAELNQEFAEQVELHESVSRKHFEQVVTTVKAIDDPQKRQAHADHNAVLFAQQNPRFDHARFHKACGTVHVNKGKVQNESSLPATALQEGLLQNDAARMDRYLDAMNKSIAHSRGHTMDGGKYQSTNTDITAMADFRATALLREQSKSKFEGKTGVTEQDAVRSRQSKANPRPNQPRLERLVDGGSSDNDFLNEINSRGLVRK